MIHDDGSALVECRTRLHIPCDRDLERDVLAVGTLWGDLRWIFDVLEREHFHAHATVFEATRAAHRRRQLWQYYDAEALLCFAGVELWVSARLRSIVEDASPVVNLEGALVRLRELASERRELHAALKHVARYREAVPV